MSGQGSERGGKAVDALGGLDCVTGGAEECDAEADRYGSEAERDRFERRHGRHEILHRRHTFSGGVFEVALEVDSEGLDGHYLLHLFSVTLCAMRDRTEAILMQEIG